MASNRLIFLFGDFIDIENYPFTQEMNYIIEFLSTY